MGSMHRPHPFGFDDPDAVLWDGCLRCDEHARSPWISLDNGNLKRLWDRQSEVGLSQMTGNENRAVYAIKEAMATAVAIKEKLA